MLFEYVQSLTDLLSWTDGAILFAVAIIAGAQNSIAGGGSFLTFPALLFLGVPAVPANATNTVALMLGSVASSAAYRRELKEHRKPLILLTLVSAVGGYAGALLLLNTSDEAFRDLIPWLLLIATATFAFGNQVAGFLRRGRPVEAPDRDAHASLATLGAQLVISVYGGFFGAGIGILMLAALTVGGMTDLQAANGLKNWLATCINGVAVVTFVVAGTVYWPQALVMLVGAVLGGYAGASLARRLSPRTVRGFVVVIGTVLTVYFFLAK